MLTGTAAPSVAPDSEGFLVSCCVTAVYAPPRSFLFSQILTLPPPPPLLRILTCQRHPSSLLSAQVLYIYWHITHHTALRTAAHI
jgi:hypothetical protein